MFYLVVIGFCGYYGEVTENEVIKHEDSKINVNREVIANDNFMMDNNAMDKSQIILTMCIGGSVVLFVSIITFSFIAIRDKPQEQELDFSSDEFIAIHEKSFAGNRNESNSDFVLNALREINEKNDISSMDEKINKLYDIINVNVNVNQ